MKILIQALETQLHAYSTPRIYQNMREVKKKKTKHKKRITETY